MLCPNTPQPVATKSAMALTSLHQTPSMRPELLAPAGDFDAACAALQYGADAVYTGLANFSARAEATNLSTEELRRLLAYAHALPRRRRVYVTLNTLIPEHDLSGVIATLEEIDDAGADAVIVQDLGVARIARRCFPGLRLHASTQLAVHNLAGVRALAGLGFRRVVLARELSVAEAADIARAAALEIEIFVHGALCYSYSGLCLLSSHQTGRSGNRGRCAYCCREPLTPATMEDSRTPAARTFPFSMRDLALAPLLPEVATSGVASLKIEGRMKNACYVACVTDYYRRKLDGTLPPEAEAALVQDLQTIFSRPWTQLHAAGRDTPAAEVIDATAVGHRGAAIGDVLAVTRDSRRGHWLRFSTRRTLEKHDGLQIDLSCGGKPFGFAVDELRRAGASRQEISLPAGTVVEVRLPEEALPDILPGATVFCSASQAVRRRYQIQRPRPVDCRLTRPVRVHARLQPEGLTLTATTHDATPHTCADPNPGGRDVPAHGANRAVSATITAPLRLTPARQSGQTVPAIQRALDRSGDTPWQVTAITVDDPLDLFAPASLLNDARRQLFEALTAQHEAARQTRRDEAGRRHTLTAAPSLCALPRWTAKVDLAGPAQPALATADEVILHLGHLPPADARLRLDAWLKHMPRTRLRLALPLLTRQHEAELLRATVSNLLADGWHQWECADLGGWQVLRETAQEPLDLTADWSFYALNSAARELLAELGITRAVASPEDTGENIAALATGGRPEIEALAWQQTPLFISETPPLVNSASPPPWTHINRRGTRLITHRVDNRWVTIAETPFGLAGQLPALQRQGVRWFRADFLWSLPDAMDIPACWNALQAGHLPQPLHTANFLR